MVELSVRNIILISRSGMDNQNARSLVDELGQQGIKLAVYACDVGSHEQLQQTLGLCAKEMPPIRGVIQSAMVLRVSQLSKITLTQHRRKSI